MSHDISDEELREAADDEAKEVAHDVADEAAKDAALTPALRAERGGPAVRKRRAQTESRDAR